MSMLVNGSLALQLVNRPNPGSTAQFVLTSAPARRPLNSQPTTDLSTRHNGWPPPSRSTLYPKSSEDSSAPGRR
jgi:hypothetical protein